MSTEWQKIKWKEHKDLILMVLWLLALLTGCIYGSRAADAQQFNQAWGFTAQNRASIAALMKQMDNEEKNADSQVGILGGYSGSDNLICGGDGESEATGNSTCIILNNATGNIEIDQDSEGGQTATSTTEENDLTDVLSTLSE